MSTRTGLGDDHPYDIMAIIHITSQTIVSMGGGLTESQDSILNYQIAENLFGKNLI